MNEPVTVVSGGGGGSTLTLIDGATATYERTSQPVHRLLGV